MTSIKPPSGPTTTLPHTTGIDSGPANGVDAKEGVERAVDSQRTGDLSSVSQGHATRADTAEHVAAASSAASAGVQVNLVDLAKAVEAGQLTMSEAVERLVEGTVGLSRQLTELERAELSELLRSAVANDPALSALQDDPV